MAYPPMTDEERKEEHRHAWRNSREFFVGWLYLSIYPWYCKCGAFKHEDGTIIEPQPVRKEVTP